MRELCDRHGVLLILDEVATGFGRTGTHVRLRARGRRARPPLPGQGHHGRLPAAGRHARHRARSTRASSASFEEFRTFFHGHTYTGNPLACAAGIATLDVFREERTLERLQPKIELLAELLEPIAAHPAVREVRRCGFMVGIELARAPAAGCGWATG